MESKKQAPQKRAILAPGKSENMNTPFTGGPVARKLSKRVRKEAPDPTDIHVGSRVRLRRTLLGLSQERLGKSLGLTFQQVQKYERGANRIGASRLHDISRILEVPVSFFFEGMEDDAKVTLYAKPIEQYQSAAEQPQAPLHNPLKGDTMSKRETLDLVRAYYRIPSASVRKKLVELAKSMASLAEG